MGANIMLAVHCKKAEPLELRGPVQEYIAATYGDSAAQDAAEDLETIEGQRAQIVGMGGSLPSLRDLMAKCAACGRPPPTPRILPSVPRFDSNERHPLVRPAPCFEHLVEPRSAPCDQGRTLSAAHLSAWTTGRNLLIIAKCRYYRALATMETRFPISKNPGHIHLSFIWCVITCISATALVHLCCPRI